MFLKGFEFTKLTLSKAFPTTRVLPNVCKCDVMTLSKQGKRKFFVQAHSLISKHFNAADSLIHNLTLVRATDIGAKSHLLKILDVE